MRNKLLSREEVLNALAAQLEDRVLLDIFPQSNPMDIRALLTGKRPLTPRAETGKTDAQPPCGASSAINDLCRLFTDGASRGNPGEAGAGAVLLDKNGKELATHSSYLGQCTNNVAEYRALLIGLEQAASAGCRHVAVHLDSELIVRQIQGRYKVKNETLKPLYVNVVNLLEKFSSWTVTHVPRAQNTRADELANKGIDNRNN